MAILSKTELIDQLWDIGSIKIEEIVLKSGDRSPIYIDLRLVIGYPELRDSMAQILWSMAKNLEFDQVCGVMTTAFTYAADMSKEHKLPMILKRPSVKSYGTKRMVEGVYKKGERVLVLEDVITSGAGVIETVDALREAGLKVEDVCLFVDREQSGRAYITSKGVRVHSYIKMSDILDRLLVNGMLNDDDKSRISNWINQNPVALECS